MIALNSAALVLSALLAVDSTAPAPAASGPAQMSAPEIVDKVVAAYGGTAALESMHALRMTGTVLSPMRGKGELLRELERPDRLRVDVRYAQAREVRLLDKEKAFQNGKPTSGMGADAMAMQAFRLDAAGLLGRMREKAKNLGPSEQGGAKTISLELLLDRGMKLVVFVDAATFRILRSESIVGSADERIIFATNYSDFRTVAGVLFAFAEENFAGAMATGKTQLEKIEVLPSLPETTWALEK